jgi:hypothetical protein
MQTYQSLSDALRTVAFLAPPKGVKDRFAPKRDDTQQVPSNEVNNRFAPADDQTENNDKQKVPHKRPTGEMPDGDVQKKFTPNPQAKPRRRNPSFQNLSDRDDYHQNYQRDYRQQGKDYQRIPDGVKRLRQEQRKKINDRFHTKPAISAL